MRTLSFICASLIGIAPALAQVHVEVSAPPPPRVEVVAPPPPSVEVAAPTFSFSAAPPLVTVAPGVQVVRDHDEEIFFSGGWYWHAGPSGVWYRTRSWRGGWVIAPRHGVPMAVMRLPRGQYRHFRGEPWREQRREEAIRHEEHGIRHDERAIRHEERREEHHEQRFEAHRGRRG
ncbi:MAG TPA: hypothetical protein VGL86_30240 [Polyangia bacterium]